MTGLRLAGENLGCGWVADARVVQCIDGAAITPREQVTVDLQGERASAAADRPCGGSRRPDHRCGAIVSELSRRGSSRRVASIGATLPP